MAHRQHLQSAFKVLIMYKHRITTRSAVAGSPVSLEGNCVCTLDRQEVWKGGLTAWREGEWHDVIAHISTHTVRLTAGGGTVSYSISVGSQAVCVACAMLRAYNHPEQ